jgi:hypothetical protein
MMSKNNSCILCSNNEFDVVAVYSEPDQYELCVGVQDNDKYWRKWVKCTGCGLYYSLYSRDHRKLNKIYLSSYRSKKEPWRQGTNEEIFNETIALPKEKSETKLRINWIKDYINHAKDVGLYKGGNTPYKMLDIGGGNGIFAYEFQDNDWKSHVIDADPNGLFIETKLCIPYLNQYYRPKSFDTSFDLISMVFVLEHLVNPKMILNQLRQDMVRESFLYVEVPDSICFYLKSADDDIFNSCHLWMFSAYTLTELFRQTGYEICALKRVCTLRGHYALMALAQKSNI